MKLITESIEDIQILEEEANGKKVEASVYSGEVGGKL